MTDLLAELLRRPGKRVAVPPAHRMETRRHRNGVAGRAGGVETVARQRAGSRRHQTADGRDGVKVDMSAQAVTVRLQRLSQLRALCLSLAAAGRRAGLAPHPAGQQGADSAVRTR